MTEDTLEILNRLYELLNRSLVLYLSDAHPYVKQGDDQAALVLQGISADQRRMADRIGALIIDENGTVRPGHFPIHYTGLHDLSLDYLLRLLLEEQQKAIVAVEKYVQQVATAPLARSLAEEALGEAKAHLDTLNELAESHSVAP